MLLAAMYATLAACIAVFIGLGRLTPGDPMFHELETPSLLHAVAYLVGCLLVLGGCALLRRKYASTNSHGT